MKWGVRRYQNEDGSLTAEGKKRAKKEYKEDNKTAFELGKDATIYGNAAKRSMQRMIKIENKLTKRYEKDPDALQKRTQRLRSDWDASSKTTAELVETYKKKEKMAEEHCDRLLEKYGKEAVETIKYKDAKLPKGDYSPSSIKIMNERVNDASDYALALGSSLTSAGISQLFGLPIFMIYTPSSASQRGNNIENARYIANRKAR